MNKKTIKDIDIRGKRVLIRADFNVPLDKGGNITDDTRIVKTLPTIKYCLDNEAKIILMAHLGRPKGKVLSEFSLRPVATYLSAVLKKDVMFLPDCIGSEVKEAVINLKKGEIALLENLRFHPEETKNNPEFAKQLAELGEVYVDDAFGAVHRAHASVEGVTKYLPAVAGLLLTREIEYFDKALSNPEKPFVAILGGAKVSDKIKVIENLLDKLDALLIGGGMAYTFLYVQEHKIGNSILDNEGINVAKQALKKAEEKGVKLLLPEDHVVGNEYSDKAEAKTVGIDIEDGWMGLDIGPKTIESFKNALKGAKTVIWNGPLGVSEWKNFEKGTREIAKFITTLGATTIIGGGDTASAVKKLELEDKMSHISTGGGASLEYLEGKTLPGIAALQDKTASVAK